jgi:hypothetical protein
LRITPATEPIPELKVYRFALTKYGKRAAVPLVGLLSPLT